MSNNTDNYREEFRTLGVRRGEVANVSFINQVYGWMCGGLLLTALAVVVGAGVILFDPIFQGLAISLMAGEVASLLISRMAVPVL